MTRETGRNSERLRVLVLSRNYPNNVMDVLGLWVRGQVREVAKHCEVKVISPVPYCPPLPRLPANYARFRAVDHSRWDSGVESIHPRMVVGPGSSTSAIEWLLYDLGIRRRVARLRRDFPFDVIHAQFAYPDGVVAARLAHRYDVPFVLTEQNLWGPWMPPRMLRLSSVAARHSSRIIALTSAVQNSIEKIAGALGNFAIIPNGVEPSDFTLAPDPSTFDPHQIIWVGVVRPIKGVDVLLRALRLVLDRGCPAHLVIVGEAFYSTYQQEEARLKQLTIDLGLTERVRFVGKKHPPELTRYMQDSAMLVLPSRAESMGLVLAEAMACGTPVIATRCGGPEDVVNERVGLLVPPDDPEALARGIEDVIAHRHRYNPASLRTYALENFSIQSVGRRIRDVYEQVITEHRQAKSVGRSGARAPAT